MNELNNREPVNPKGVEKSASLNESTDFGKGTPHKEITIEQPEALTLVRVKPEPLTEEDAPSDQMILNNPARHSTASDHQSHTTFNAMETAVIENNDEPQSSNVPVSVKQEPNIQDTTSSEAVVTNHTELLGEETASNATIVRVKQEPIIQNFNIEEANGDKIKQTAAGVVRITEPCEALSEAANILSKAVNAAAFANMQTNAATSEVVAPTQIKPEPATCIPENIPDDFFDDLLDNADQLTSNLSPPHPTWQTGSETSPQQVVTTQNASPLTSQTTIAAAAAIPHLPIKVKIELNKDVEEKSVTAGDEMDDIPTPCASPNRLALEPTLNAITSQTREPCEQVRVKDEPINDVHINADPIPDNFFDDLLDDRSAVRVADREVPETKYSDKMREIQEKIRQLEEDEMAQGDLQVSSSTSHKHKHKKSKKKSRKRERSLSRERRKAASTENEAEIYKRRRRRSRSREQTNARDDLLNNAPQFNANYGNLPKVPQLPELPSDMEVENVKTEKVVSTKTSAAFGEQESHANNDKDIDCLPVHPSISGNSNAVHGLSGFKRIKLEKPSKEAEPLILTSAMKRQKALKLAAETVHNFQQLKKQCSPSFEYVSTVRKLPNSRSFVTQEIYENRSPLHSINNVRYSFNSASTRFNLREWGLEALPKVAARVARAVGYDADTLFSKLHASKLTNKYNKIKRDPDDNSESIDETKSSFFTNAMTQTDDVYVTSRRRNAHDIGIQVIPTCGSISTQTSASASANSVGTNDDLPLMQMINVLNENQLMALSDFAELIREPAATAMDMYRLRTRMLEIYKCSQLPSAMSTTPPAPAATIHSLPSIQLNSKEFRQQQEPPFVIRDPRSLANFSSTSNAPYAQQQQQRIFASHASFRTSPQQSYADPRLQSVQHQQPVNYQGIPILQQQQRPVNNQGVPTLQHQPPVANKNYGRGSMRR